MPRVNINGYAFEYVEQGSGDPLVLVHGSASDYRTWQFQVGTFARHYRTISYSRRYHWPNQPIADGVDYAMPEHVEDLKKFIHALDAGPAHLVGHSYGAFLCLLLSIREPQLVRNLVLSEPPVITLFVSSDPRPVELLKLFITRPRTAAAIIRFGSKVVPARNAFRREDLETGIRKYGEAVFGRNGFDRLSETRKAQVRDNISNAKAEILGSGFTDLDPEQVRRISKPVLLISGRCSLKLFRQLIDRLDELLPHANRIEIEGASHLVHEDNVRDYNRAVLSFLSQNNEAV